MLSSNTPTDATPFWYQLRLVSARNAIALWRSPEYIFTRIFVCTCISFFVSLSFLQLGNSVRELQFRVFAIFWVIVLPAMVMSQIEPMFIYNRRTFIRGESFNALEVNLFKCVPPYRVFKSYLLSLCLRHRPGPRRNPVLDSVCPSLLGSDGMSELVSFSS